VAPLGGQVSPALVPAVIGIKVQAFASRFVFRGGDAAADATGQAFGVPLLRAACRAATLGSRAALWLGPDEWLLIAPDGEAPAIAAAIAEGLDGSPHSLVDVSHRNTGFEISGSRAGDLLNAGCPLDLGLAAFPVGMCTRSVLAKAEIILWRTAELTFHLEVWRSFAPYVGAFLQEAAQDELVSRS
jgi:sarcosine oxidase subunit gamma